MKIFYIFVMMCLFLSCSNDENRGTTIMETPKINANWKPSNYEYKGKIYNLNDCDKKGQLLINTDFSGVYENFEKSSASSACITLESYSGKWSYDNLTRVLTLTYNEAGAPKTLKKEIESFSDSELRIIDNTKNLDGIPGNDEALLIYIKN